MMFGPRSLVLSLRSRFDALRLRDLGCRLVRRNA
nr:MAG TPA: hypothetical protein [Bacteriophage sp.]